ncbi:MAG: asparagine synthetase B [Candidatus Bathyarchaeia archaeon]
MGALIAVVNKRGENATQTAVKMLKILRRETFEAFGIASPRIVKIEKSIDALQNENVNSPVVVGYAFSKTLPQDKPQPIRLEDAALAFDGRIYPNPTGICDAEIFAKKLRENQLENIFKAVDSEFAFALANSHGMVSGRDTIGIRPLYYGENVDYAAVSSERKALWKIGINTVNSFPPGHIAFIDEHGFKFKRVKTLTKSQVKKISMQTAAEELQKLLQKSVKERLSGLKEVAVAFSGGLDSSILASLAKSSVANVHLIHVSLNGQPETEEAKEAAEALKLPLHIRLYNENDVKATLSKVLWLVEEPTPLNVSVGIPFYWAAEKAAEMGVKVLLAGQGADELFGGYRRYVNDYLRYGVKRVEKTMFNDVFKMYETNFERDFKICNYHNVELRFPFATYPLAEFATKLPLELKIERKANGLRKLVLRKLAKNLGLPNFIVEKPKRAIQYSTGVNKTLKKLARREELTVREYLEKKFQTLFKKMVENG